MSIAEWMGLIATVVSLVGLGFAISRAYERFVSRPRQESLGLSEPSELLPVLNTIWATPELDRLVIVGYSVHSLYDPLNPLIAYALKRKASVRVFMLDPASRFLEERARSESERTSLDSAAFLLRSRRSINRTAERILESIETIKYQNNLSESNSSLRVYSAPPVYRGVLSNRGVACSSYLENLEMPSRDFLMTDPRTASSFNEREGARAANWVDYLTKFRSRPYSVEAILIDLYDTLLDVDEIAQRTHQLAVADEAGLSIDEFVQEWERTRECSNTGGFGTTAERFADILEQHGSVDKLLADRLATMEHHYLRSTFSLSDDAHEFLQALRSRGYKIGIVSNCSISVMEVLTHSGIGVMVDSLNLSFVVGQLKPHPLMYQRALEELAVPAERAVYIGDGADEELEGARVAGMRVLQAKWYVRKGATGSVQSASSFSDAARWLDPEAAWPVA